MLFDAPKSVKIPIIDENTAVGKDEVSIATCLNKFSWSCSCKYLSIYFMTLECCLESDDASF